MLTHRHQRNARAIPVAIVSPINTCVCVVCRMSVALDPATRSASLFTSSSVSCALFPDKGATCLGGGNVRAYNRFAIRTTPTGADSCVVSVINQVVFGGWFPQFVMDKVVTDQFLQGVFDRTRKHIHAKRGVPRGPSYSVADEVPSSVVTGDGRRDDHALAASPDVNRA